MVYREKGGGKAYFDRETYFVTERASQERWSIGSGSSGGGLADYVGQARKEGSLVQEGGWRKVH